MTQYLYAICQFFVFLFANQLATAAPAAESNKKIWFEDRDGDGYGNSSVYVSVDTQPPGFVAWPGDCNDNPYARGNIFYPWAKEACNYDDNNCDGFVALCPLAPRGRPIPQQQNLFVLSSFERGHPFAVTGAGPDNLNDPSDGFPELGASQSAWMQTAGDGSLKTMRAFEFGNFDFGGAMPKLWLKVRDGANAADISLFLGNRRLKNYVRFNLKSSQGQKWLTDGDWTAVSVSWNQDNFSGMRLEKGVSLEDLRRNITDVQLQIRDNGKGPIALHVNRVGAVRDRAPQFPNGVISITFDDNLESQYLFAKPKLDQYGFAATAYVIVGFLDTPNYMSTKQLWELNRRSKWEVGFHAFDPFMHVVSYPNFPEALVERDILAGKQWLWQMGFGFGRDGKHGLAHFAFPKGEFKQTDKTDILKVVRRHFSSARTINERWHESVTPSDAHKLRVIYITKPESVAMVAESIRNSIAAGEWVILVLHDLVTEPQVNDQWEIEKFNDLVDFIANELPTTPVATIGDVLSNL